jgi:hypothetical protein
MFNTFFSPTAQSIPFSSSQNGLDAFNIQDAINKLAFLTQISNLMNQDGSITFRIGAAPTSVILPSPVGKWKIAVTDDGLMTSELLSVNDPSILTYWNFKADDGTIASIEIDSQGEIIMVDPPSTTGASISHIFLTSPSGYMFSLNVDGRTGEFYTDSASTPLPSFRVVDQTDQVLFSMVQQNSLALNYLPVYDISNLPTNPVGISNTMPWIFVRDLSGMQRPVFFDGQGWRYFSNDQLVISSGGV